MNAGVALIRAYLQVNAYFTVSELPVIRRRKHGTYEQLTDVDILALRFPRARHLVSEGRPGPADDLTFAHDPVLDVGAGFGGVGASCRIRLVAFGHGEPGPRHGFTVISLRHVAGFLEEHLGRYHEILHPADLTDPVLGLLHLLKKVEEKHGGRGER